MSETFELESAADKTQLFDLRGHGRSEGKRGVCTGYDLLHSDLEALLNKTREFYPDVPHILYGHSLGGGLVLSCAS